MANIHSSFSAQQEDDVHDQIGSTTSTPSGMATPQLDPADKRLPGIMHNFFAQVRACSDSASPSPNHQRSSTTPAASERQSQVVGEAEVSSGNRSLSGSIVFLERDQISDSAPSEQRSGPVVNEGSLKLADPKSLPTPPHSSSSSIIQRDTEEAENGAPLVAEKGVGSVYQALKSLIMPRNSSKRRHTSSPVSSVSNDAVLASHFSNPSLPAPEPQTLPACPESSKSISKSSEELAKLTNNAAVGPRTKNTPPLTPRAMSSETQHTDKRSTHSLASSPARSQAGSNRSDGQPSTRTSSAHDEQGPLVGPIKGKLNVKISEGRGLRPSHDPYVVCVFEWNEYISKGAQEAEHKKSRLDAVGSVPIQRSNSDSGRPMAIPMKSRQSSQNSAMDGSDPKRSGQVTDPLWNHDAVLCVAFFPP